MAQALHLSRYHPAVLSVVGMGAAYGIYTLLTAYASRSAATTLRRNNPPAPRDPNRQIDGAYWVRPSPGAPLGTIMLTRDGETVEINLATNRILDAITLRPMLGPDIDSVLHVQTLALDVTITTCFSASQDPDLRAELEELGLHELISALAARDEERILQACLNIRRLMVLDRVTVDHMQQSVETLLTSRMWNIDAGGASEPYGGDPAETEDLDMLHESGEPSQGLRALLYYIAEDDAKRKAYEHRGIQCEECGRLPIKGIRWHCLNCPDFDLCSSCEAHSRHPKTHVFAKIKIPLPVLSQPSKEYRLWYPGDPRKLHTPLDPAVKKRLYQDNELDEPQIDAWYDQFTCMANVSWPQDPSKVHSAIDRQAFNRALTSDRWPSGFATNAMYDRMYAFYDTDSNGLIGFEEFVSGLAYLRGPRRFCSLQRAIQGYDIDGDGHVNRADFLRLLRAKFVIQKQLVDDSIAGREMEQTQAGLSILHSSQPISSIFSEESIPAGEFRHPRGKRSDAYGDLQPLSGTKTILDDEDDVYPSTNVTTQEELNRHTSRLEEMIYGAVSTSESSDRAPAHAEGSTADTQEEAAHMPASILGPYNVLVDPHDEVREPFMQDAIWRVTEEGFMTLLDVFFKQREEDDALVMSTLAERQQWRAEVEAEIDNETLQSPTTPSDHTFGAERIYPDHILHPAPATFNSASGAPTDRQILEWQEADVSSMSFSEQLAHYGYTVGNTDDPIVHPPRVAASSHSTIWDGSASTSATSPLRLACSSDESMKSTTPASNNLQAKPPPKARMQLLARAEILERAMDKRGGPGRLSYEEIERVTKRETDIDLCGLVRAWLEWASF